MSKNPLLNALAATAYITLIAAGMWFGSKFASGPDNSIIAPMAMISLFTLSAAVMGFIFLYQPFVLYFDNKRKEAIQLFIKTIIIFAGITLLFLTLLFSGLFK